MDFGGLDRLVSSDTNNIINININNTNNNSVIMYGYDLDPNPKLYGFKDERSLSATAHNQDLKVPKLNQDCFSKTMLQQLLQQQQQQQRSNCNNSVLSDSQNMLSFSSPNTHQTSTFPFYARNNTGYGGNMSGVLAGVKGPFTPSQWMELEHQALIFKYISINAPIPSNLLIPIKKALESAAFSSNLRQPTYGWVGFHLGFSNSSDPEPGRCRRTDGKKWRCSKDAVEDQKYCERHINRGRHRSRKPVEGQNGHSVPNGPTTTAAAAKNLASATVVNNHIINHLHQQNNQQLNHKMMPAITLNPTPYSNDNRSFLNKGAKIEPIDQTMLLPSSSIDLKQNPLSEFGFVCSDSLFNPLHKANNESEKSQNSLRQFMDDWPRSDKTQLSISIPTASTDLMSSNSSTLNMGLGVGDTTNTTNVFDEMSQQVNWIPISWEPSMGGPLGEVLNHSTNNSPPALDLMTDGWGSSQRTTLSPTGVLQKPAFGCFSNSSSGSSPRTDNSLCGSTLLASSLPLL